MSITPPPRSGWWHKTAGLLRSFYQDEEAATAVEYGLILGGIAVAILTVMLQLGSELEKIFVTLQQNILEQANKP